MQFVHHLMECNRGACITIFDSFDLKGMYKAGMYKCSPFFQFISQEISQATISLVSLLEFRKRRLKSLETKYTFSRYKSKVKLSIQKKTVVIMLCFRHACMQIILASSKCHVSVSMKSACCVLSVRKLV